MLKASMNMLNQRRDSRCTSITITKFWRSGGVGQSRIGLPALPRITLKSISSATTSSTGSTSRGWQGCQPKEHLGHLDHNSLATAPGSLYNQETGVNRTVLRSQSGPAAGKAEVSSVNKHRPLATPRPQCSSGGSVGRSRVRNLPWGPRR